MNILPPRYLEEPRVIKDDYNGPNSICQHTRVVPEGDSQDQIQA